MKAIENVPSLVKQLYEIVGQLENLFPGRHFTLDGHLVGSIGEVLAAHRYGLKLALASTEGYDAETADRKRVEIKATQGDRIGLRSEPDHLVVLQIKSDGTFQEIYNGPGLLAWNQAGELQNNGQRQISIAKLRELMKQVPKDGMLPTVHP